MLDDLLLPVGKNVFLIPAVVEHCSLRYFECLRAHSGTELTWAPLQQICIEKFIDVCRHSGEVQSYAT